MTITISVLYHIYINVPSVVLYVCVGVLRLSHNLTPARCVLRQYFDVVFRFCPRHGPKSGPVPQAPAELMCVARSMLPKLIYRAIQYMRDLHSAGASTWMVIYVFFS